MNEYKEEWRPVLWHEGYEVSSLGRVRSLDRWVVASRGIDKGIRRLYKGRILKPGLNRLGYHYVSLPGRKLRTVHRLVAAAFLGITKDQDVDHIDGNPSNNLLSNLRACSQSENGGNQNKSERNTSGFKGVCWCKQRRKWVAQIMAKGKRIYLGHYDSIEEAARAYDQTAIKHFGPFARTKAMLATEASA